MVALAAEPKDQVLLLGKRRGLVGILTRPAAGSGEAPALVILNTGIVHRVGHHRMYVTLARELAARGQTVVRFDFSGVGDSEPRNDHLSPLAACLADIKDVLDSVQASHKLSRFILMGLCSGADHAVLYGHTDPRVVGLILMDPTLPPTARYYWHYIRQRLGNVRNWASVLTGRSGLMRRLLAHFVHSVRYRSDLQSLTLENLQFSSYLGQCYKSAAARGIKMLSVFTSLSVRHTYHQQLVDAFPEAASTGGLRLEFFPDSDHLFSAPAHQARLQWVIVDWLRRE